MPGHSANQNDANSDCKQLLQSVSNFFLSLLNTITFPKKKKSVTYCRWNDQLVIPSERLLLSLACPNAKDDGRNVEKTKNHSGGHYEARFLIIGLGWSHVVLVDEKKKQCSHNFVLTGTLSLVNKEE